MPKLDYDRTCNTRSNGGYTPFKFKGNQFNNSFFLNTSKMWNFLPKAIQSKKIDDFKEKKPPKYKHFARGSKLSNALVLSVAYRLTIVLQGSRVCSLTRGEEY